jgi:hypothetical protein
MLMGSSREKDRPGRRLRRTVDTVAVVKQMTRKTASMAKPRDLSLMERPADLAAIGAALTSA